MRRPDVSNGPDRKRAAHDVLERAHQLELEGRMQEACATLEQFVDTAWPWSRAALEAAWTSAGKIPCQRAMALLNERRGRSFSERQDRRALVAASFALAYAAFAAFATHQGLRGSQWWFIATALAVPIVPLVAFGALFSLWHRNAWQRPRWATVRNVTVLPEGPDVGPPTCVAELTLDSQPERLRRIAFTQGLVVEAGMRLLVVEQGSSVRWLL